MSVKNRILYIEDNYQNRRLVKRLLKRKGYELIEAEDGLQGIAIAAREKPDLILMDINLPGIDGMEATSRIKSSSDLSHIPIIAITAAAMRGDRERIMAAGCDDYLQKPIDNDQLVETVRRFLGSPAEETKPAVSDLKALAHELKSLVRDLNNGTPETNPTTSPALPQTSETQPMTQPKNPLPPGAATPSQTAPSGHA
ncbi:MAG TPA: response regulator [Aggregatilineales bacterium]|nr:response regulator [Aggregatilineales bacterium]